MPASGSFAKAVASFSEQFSKIEGEEEKLFTLKAQLVSRLSNAGIGSSSLRKDNPFSEVTNKLQLSIVSGIKKWADDWQQGQATREFSEAMQDKVIFLVFGKVNAGKSSLCNYLASLFPDEYCRYFALEQGVQNEIASRFSEGITETTARIQGVELMTKLVLLDTPGLYSVTDENHALTKRFTDSADAVLWLTPSTSPGQVDELQELSTELSNNKPLLPVITRSDEYDEDCNEEGELIRVLLNKSAARREGQERDVHERAAQKLKQDNCPGELRAPVSVSVHAYQHSEQTSGDLVSSGLDKLQMQLIQLIDQASEYKPEKAWQQVVNYLNCSVLQTLDTNIKPAIENYKIVIAEALNNSKNLQLATTKKLLSDLHIEVVNWADELKKDKDTGTLATRIENSIKTKLEAQLMQCLSEFVDELKPVIVKKHKEQLGEYKDIEIDYKEIEGRALQSATSSGVAMVFSGVGAVLGGGIGMAVGGMVGGLIGDKLGASFVETKIRTKKVGVDDTELLRKINNDLETSLPTIVSRAFESWDSTLEQLYASADEISAAITDFEVQMQQGKVRLN